jgi:hypothetical protein
MLQFVYLLKCAPIYFLGRIRQDNLNPILGYGDMTTGTSIWTSPKNTPQPIARQQVPINEQKQAEKKNQPGKTFVPNSWQRKSS